MMQYKELFIKYFTIINKIFEVINLKQKNNNIDKELIQYMNDLMNIFGRLVKLFNGYNIQKMDTEALIEKMSSDLVNVIELINDNEVSRGIELLLNNVKDNFNILEDLLNKKLKFRVFIYGVNDISIKLKELINYDNSELLFYISNDPEHWNKQINGIPIVALEEALKHSCDYLIIADTNLNILNKVLAERKIDNEQIFNYFYYLYNFDLYGSPEFFTQYYNFIKNDKRYEGIITGISYTQKGINADLLPRRFFNFACASQDLFYDLEMLKYALRFNETKETVRYTIIGLCYYSFQYDLSRSVAGNYRSNYYFKILGKYHNYDLAEENKSFYKRFCKISKKILRPNYDGILYDILKEQYIEIIENGKNEEFNSFLLNDEERAKCIREVKRKYDKNYPLTLEENKKIFKKYLDILYRNNIKPIVVVPPETELYRENISILIRDQFYEIIDGFQKKYDFQFLDYFYCNDFSDGDFYDFCHLNNKGSEKLTKLLSSDINW